MDSGVTMNDQERRLFEDFTFISADSYLDLFPEAGASYTFRAFDIPYYVMHSCICAGEIGQIIMPPARNGRSYILTESFNHRHDDTMVAAILSSALMHAGSSSGSIKVLDEAVPLYPMWSLGNFWHWIFESVPKICLLESSGYTGQYIVNASTPVVVEGMKLLGIAPERIVHCADPHLVKRAVIPSIVPHSALAKYKRLLWTVRERLLEVAGMAEGEKHCFIRRIGARKLLNEEELLDTLRAYDIQVLVPEEHSIREQIHFMSNVKLTLSPHGANTTLALFQKHKSILMEFFGADYVNNTCNISTIQTLKLLYIPVTEVILREDRQHFRARLEAPQGEPFDYTIDVTLVAAILENLRSVSYHI